MALQLIESLAAAWEPDKYTDEYVANLMRIIQAKVKGRRPKLEARETPQTAEVVDLMARLRASLEGQGAKKTAKTAAKGKKKTAARKRSGRAA
jgi:DNA end-binding protein Ku